MRVILATLVWLGLILTAHTPAQAEPARVTVGMYVNDIQAVNLATNSYVVDFYLWFRWSDPAVDPMSSFELMNTFDPEGHVETLLYDEPVPQPDGSFYNIVRHQGAFSAKFPLMKYPFDTQNSWSPSRIPNTAAPMWSSSPTTSRSSSILASACPASISQRLH